MAGLKPSFVLAAVRIHACSGSECFRGRIRRSGLLHFIRHVDHDADGFALRRSGVSILYLKPSL